jgi:D-aminoacyl-tRNA deacylase
MRAVIQRIQNASITVPDDSLHRQILIADAGPGLLTLLGIYQNDTKEDAEWLIRKISALRIFADTDGKMNLSLQDIGGTHLLVSQFTLCADTSKGNRPSFIAAARPEQAIEIYNHALEFSKSLGLPTKAGQFQADMKITLLNDGPVTIVLDSPSKNP